MLRVFLAAFQLHIEWTALAEDENIKNYLHEFYSGTAVNPSDSYWFLQKKYSALYLKPFSLKDMVSEVTGLATWRNVNSHSFLYNFFQDKGAEEMWRSLG